MGKHIIRRTLIVILVVCVLFSGVAISEETQLKRLDQGISPMDAMVIMATAAQLSDLEVDMNPTTDTVQQTISIKAGIFTLSVHIAANKEADSVTIACAYLDADYARTMGQVFGMCLGMLGGFEDVNLFISTIDFDVFGTLEANTQTLVSGNYKVIVKVAPTDDNPYQLTLALLTAQSNVPTEDTLNAADILSRMNAELSASFVYDESTDLNGVLGQEGKYSSKANFALASISPFMQDDPGIEVEDGGSIEVFDTEMLALERACYTAQVKLQYFGGSENVFVYKTALLRLSGSLSSEEIGQLITSFIDAVDGKPATSGIGNHANNEPVACAVGDAVLFGSYEQDGSSTNGMEPISWLVLDVSDGQAMLVSSMALDVWNTYWESPTWDNSTLRQWLNEEFYQIAFDETQRQALVLSDVKADLNPNYSSDPGQDTQDRVFCLSYPEADALLTNARRRTEPTKYAIQRGVYTSGGRCYWWLRSPGKPGSGAAIVATDGSYDYDATYDGFCYGVRPVIRVDLTKVEFGE